MKIQSFLVKSFQSEGNDVVLDVPKGSIFRKMMLFHDGIYGLFEVPELQMNSTERIKYALVVKGDSIPENSEYVDIIDAIIELPAEGDSGPRQAIQVIPIYKLLN